MRLGAAAALLLGLPGAAEGAWYDSLVAQLRVPPGFKVDVYGEVPAARSLAVAPSGTVFVGAYDFSGIQGDDGREVAVYALRDLDGNGDALGPGEAIAVTEEMACPNGVAFLGTDLYVAQRHRILKYADIETNIEKRKRPTVLIGQENPIDSGNGLPNTHWHGWRYIKANPRTNKLYVAIGSPCNVPDNGEVQDCANTQRHPLLGSIAEIDPLSSRPGLSVVAHGIRNSLGLAFHPDNDDMWFTENGRDQWGGNWHVNPTGEPELEGGEETEDMPPGEINRLPHEALSYGTGAADNRGDPPNLDYGFPRCYGRDHPDPTLDFHGHPFNPGDCPFNALGNIALAVKEQVGAVVDLPPHSATLGLTWYPSNAPTGSPAFPPEYRGRVFYASHGSWDRTIPSGYVVGMAAIENPTQANSHTPQPSLEEFLGGFILEPKVSCQTNDDCPGSSHCQTNAPSHGQRFRYCGGIGRPADVSLLPDGSMLVTDETNSLVYRIAYVGDESSGAGTVILVLLLVAGAAGAAVRFGPELKAKYEAERRSRTPSVWHGDSSPTGLAPTPSPSEPAYSPPEFSTAAIKDDGSSPHAARIDFDRVD